MKRADQLNQSILTVEEIEHRAQLMFDTHQDMGLCRRSELVTVSQRFQAALRRFNKTVYRILPDIDSYAHLGLGTAQQVGSSIHQKILAG